MQPIPDLTQRSGTTHPISGKRIFITGGAGFIGSTLVARLIDDNDIVVYDNLRRNSTNNRSLENHKNLKLVKGCIMDYPTLREAMQGANIVVHCAAIAGIDTVIKSPTDTMRVNMVGTAKVL